jgi:hypothetical protein
MTLFFFFRYVCRGKEEKDFKSFFPLSLFPCLDHSPNTTHTLTYPATTLKKRQGCHALQTCSRAAAHKPPYATLPCTMMRQGKVTLSPLAYKY